MGTVPSLILAQLTNFFTNTTVRGAYTTRGHPVFAPVALADARFNRATLYPSSRLHAFWISDPRRLSPDAREGRLALSMFWGGNCQKYFQKVPPPDRAAAPDYVALARRYVMLSNQRRLAALLGMFAGDATYASAAAASFGGPLEGRDAISRGMHAFFARYRWDGSRDTAWSVDEYRLVGSREVAFVFDLRAADTSADVGGRMVERRATERLSFLGDGLIEDVWSSWCCEKIQP